jgi:hypothetical protein
MAEVEATIPENSEPQDSPPEEQAPAAAPPESQPEEPPKRGRGRPAGAKDKVPRSTKPRVRVEPIPQPAAPKAAPAPEPAEPRPIPQPAKKVEDRSTPVVEERKGMFSQNTPPPVEERPPSPEPPSPRTLYRQTSAHLLNLRDVMNSQKRASAAERYTARLQAWPVV